MNEPTHLYQRGLPIQERVLRYVEMIPIAGCWLWTAGLNRGGYANIDVAGKTRSAHRVAFEVWRGPIPCLRCGVVGPAQPDPGRTYLRGRVPPCKPWSEQ